ncbi:glycine oxidase ThiO [Auraticoccus monumenti]|uniref:glycine oxidase n=1 Tax=Auraticoccus monumenti TaxID=675864 RepID=A0A1G7DR06_9ACTN|nr:glycine oxidase ThiO [Auraticoccus monumenti]SDE53852.1 glycine oxidase [Auraticoccus monumenti]
MPTTLVVGGGLIGTAVAWRLAQRGQHVTVVAGDPGQAASGVAAGMLAPLTESAFTETALLALNLDSLRRWETFAEELERVSGLPSGLHRTPTLSVAGGTDDAARLRDLGRWLDDRGHPCRWLTSRELRGAEPLLGPSVRGGLLVERDWSCDNRRLWTALRVAAERLGVRTVTGTVLAVEHEDGRATGVRTEDGQLLAADEVVIASGAWAGGHGLPFELPVRPVKGQVLRLSAGRLPRLAHTVRAFTQGSEVYLVPRSDGEVVVGATVEEQGFDARVTAGGVYELLRDARQVVPVTAEYELSECRVGWRPATPDNAPVLGPTPLAGLTVGVGMYRNGVLLTPLVADVLAGWVDDAHLEPVATPFTLERFAS